MSELKPGDKDFSRAAADTSAAMLADAIETVPADSESFQHGGFIQTILRHIGGRYYIATVTATNGYNGWGKRWLIDKVARTATAVGKLITVQGGKAVAGRKPDSVDSANAIAVAVGHDSGPIKSFELAFPPGDTDLLPPHADFSDVPRNHRFYPHIMAAVRRGVISGYDDGTFRPDANMTRGQVIKVLVEALGWRE